MSLNYIYIQMTKYQVEKHTHTTTWIKKSMCIPRERKIHSYVWNYTEREQKIGKNGFPYFWGLSYQKLKGKKVCGNSTTRKKSIYAYNNNSTQVTQLLLFNEREKERREREKESTFTYYYYTVAYDTSLINNNVTSIKQPLMKKKLKINRRN